MKHVFGFLAISALLLVSGELPAQVPLGQVAAIFPYTPSRLLADPVRPRIYVADPPSHNLAVIDTMTLAVAATVPAGTDPVDLAIAPDGSVLYVVDHASTQAAVRVIDLASLTVTATFPLPAYPMAVALGGASRLYVSASPNDNAVSSIYQIDPATGTVQTMFNQATNDNAFLQISPDGSTLFVANRGSYDADDNVYVGTLETFALASDPPADVLNLDQYNQDTVQLVISHDGQHFCLVGSAGNSPTPGPAETYLFATFLGTPVGSFANGGQIPGPLAFSPDDEVVYQTLGNVEADGAANMLQVFDTGTFAQLDQVPFPAAGGAGYYNTVTAVVTDYLGGYLFIGESAVQSGSDPGEPAAVGQLVVMGTGRQGVVLSPHPAFFNGEVELANGVYFLAFANRNDTYFGYYSYLADAAYIYHFDLGYEYVFDAGDDQNGIYLYDFASSDFFYTSPDFPFPYLYDFNLNTVLYYYPDPANFERYNTNGVRYFYDFSSGQIIAR